MKTIILIPARMASKRLPGKPMIKINGKPMIQRVWEQAVNTDLGEVYVACSEIEVFNLIKDIGGQAVLTDPNLPSGTDRIHSAIMKVSKNFNFDCIINLQGDMPLIESKQIRRVLEPIKNNFLIGTIATTLEENEKINPNITKVVIDWKNDIVGRATEFFRTKNKIEKNTFHHVGIYSFTTEALSNFVKLPKSKNEILLNLEQYRAMDAGINIGIIFEKDIPLSIDTKEDLITAESIIRAKNEKN